MLCLIVYCIFTLSSCINIPVKPQQVRNWLFPILWLGQLNTLDSRQRNGVGSRCVPKGGRNGMKNLTRPQISSISLKSGFCELWYDPDTGTGTGIRSLFSFSIIKGSWHSWKSHYLKPPMTQVESYALPSTYPLNALQHLTEEAQKPEQYWQHIKGTCMKILHGVFPAATDSQI